VTNENGAVVNRKDFSAFGEETSTSQRTSALGYTNAEARNEEANKDFPKSFLADL
jgi:hypothetical protein